MLCDYRLICGDAPCLKKRRNVKKKKPTKEVAPPLFTRQRRAASTPFRVESVRRFTLPLSPRQRPCHIHTRHAHSIEATHLLLCFHQEMVSGKRKTPI